MKKLTVFFFAAFLFGLGHDSLNAVKLIEFLSPFEINTSLARLKTLASGDCGENPICSAWRSEIKENLGSIRWDHNTLYLTFGDDLIYPAEFYQFKSFVRYKPNPKSVGVEYSGDAGSGEVHATASWRFSELNDTVISKVKEVVKQHQLKNIWIEGYSRGTQLSQLFGVQIKKDVEVENVWVLNFATLNVFDQTAAHWYDQFMGRDNIVSIIAEEDIANLHYSENRGFYPVGTRISFVAKDFPLYRKRIEAPGEVPGEYESQKNLSKHYTHLDLPPMITVDAVAKELGSNILTLQFFDVLASLKMMMPHPKWEAHVPETYEEAAGSAFLAFKSKLRQAVSVQEKKE